MPNYIPDPRLEGLTGATRRAEYLRLRAVDRDAQRAAARLPTKHACVVGELKVAQMLPAPGFGDADERRGIRNKLKAMRRAKR